MKGGIKGGKESGLKEIKGMELSKKAKDRLTSQT